MAPPFRRFPLTKVFQLIEPSPVVLVTTSRKKRDNVMTMSWHMMMGTDPPLIGCGIGPWNHSYAALKKSQECVIAIPPATMMRQVVRIGNCSGKDVDKFSKFHLTKMPATKVKAPLIAECFVNLECRVIDTTMSRTYNLFVVEVKRAWINAGIHDPATFHAHGDGRFVMDGETVNMKREMVKWKGLIR